MLSPHAPQKLVGELCLAFCKQLWCFKFSGNSEGFIGVNRVVTMFFSYSPLIPPTTDPPPSVSATAHSSPPPPTPLPAFQLQPTHPPHHRPPSQRVDFESFFGRFRVIFESILTRDSKTTRKRPQNDTKSTPWEGGRWWGMSPAGGL